MLHWPSCETGGGCGPSTDPACNFNASTYDDSACRLSTWRALLHLWKTGVALSVGVSNFNISHLQEISDAGLVLPSLNQVSFSLYHSVPERGLLEFCKAHGILFVSANLRALRGALFQPNPCPRLLHSEPSLDLLVGRTVGYHFRDLTRGCSNLLVPLRPWRTPLRSSSQAAITRLLRVSL
jgi:hypothetical protein